MMMMMKMATDHQLREREQPARWQWTSWVLSSLARWGGGSGSAAWWGCSWWCAWPALPRWGGGSGSAAWWGCSWWWWSGRWRRRERGGRRHLFQRRYPQFGGFISLGSEGSLYGPTTCPSLLGKLENPKAPPYMFQDQASWRRRRLSWQEEPGGMEELG